MQSTIGAIFLLLMFALCNYLIAPDDLLNRIRTSLAATLGRSQAWSIFRHFSMLPLLILPGNKFILVADIMRSHVSRVCT